MKKKIRTAARAAAPFVQTAVRAAAPLALTLAFAVAMNAQTGTGIPGLDNATSKGQILLTWLRNIALLVFVGCLVWGCIEAAVESWREGRGKIFTSIGCAIVAGIAQGLISGLYSTNG